MNSLSLEKDLMFQRSLARMIQQELLVTLFTQREEMSGYIIGLDEEWIQMAGASDPTTLHYIKRETVERVSSDNRNLESDTQLSFTKKKKIRSMTYTLSRTSKEFLEGKTDESA